MHAIRLDPTPLAMVLSVVLATGLPTGVSGQDPNPGATEPAKGDDVRSSATLTYLYGFGWSPRDAHRDVLTVEYARSWSLGDSYFIFEAYELLAARTPGASAPTTWAEWHPRLSLTGLTGGRMAFGPIGNVALAGELNVGHESVAILYGLGLDWQLPGATSWLTTNVYVRDDRALSGSTWHLLATGGVSGGPGGSAFKLFGFVDVFGPEGARRGAVYGELQVLFDIGRFVHAKPGSLFGGIELHASQNAFGNGRGSELVPQIAIQWGF